MVLNEFSILNFDRASHLKQANGRSTSKNAEHCIVQSDQLLFLHDWYIKVLTADQARITGHQVSRSGY